MFSFEMLLYAFVILFIYFIYLFSHLADAFIQSDLHEDIIEATKEQ